MLQKAIDRLHYLTQSLPSQFRLIPEQLFGEKPSPEKWSKVEILGHLIDSAVNNQQRFIRAQYEDVPKIRYDQNQWNKLNHYRDNNMDSVIELWKLMNQQIVLLCSHIPETSLARLCDTGDAEPHTIEWLIIDYVEHQEHHLKQILDYE